MTDATATPGPAFAMKRTKGDIVLGALLVLSAIIILMHVVLATAVSVLFIGWTALISGIVALAVSIFAIGKEGFWTGLLAGGMLTVLGLVMVRNPGLAALSLTIVAGATFLASGVARLAAAMHDKEARAALLLGGGVSTLLGLMILFNLFSSTLGLLGVMLGIQVLAEGLSMMLAGRLRAVAEPAAATA